MRKAFFTLETFPNEIFEGYTQDEDWNGWVCPYFTFKEAQKIVDAHRKTGQNAIYNESLDSFLFEVQDEEDIYQPIELENTKLYPIGNSSWIWEESK